jgi:hypothetical protein
MDWKQILLDGGLILAGAGCLFAAVFNKTGWLHVPGTSHGHSRHLIQRAALIIAGILLVLTGFKFFAGISF